MLGSRMSEQAGADKDHGCGETPLLLAAANGHVEIVRLLVEDRTSCTSPGDSRDVTQDPKP